MEPWIRKACAFWTSTKVLAGSAKPRKPGAGIYAGVLFDAALAINHLKKRDGILAPEESTTTCLGAALRAHRIPEDQIEAAFQDCLRFGLLDLITDGDRPRVRIVGWDDEWRPLKGSAERTREWRARRSGGPDVTSHETGGDVTEASLKRLGDVSRDVTVTSTRRHCDVGTGTGTERQYVHRSTTTPIGFSTRARVEEGGGTEVKQTEIEQRLTREGLADASTRRRAVAALAALGDEAEQRRALDLVIGHCRRHGREPAGLMGHLMRTPDAIRAIIGLQEREQRDAAMAKGLDDAVARLAQRGRVS